MRKYFASDFMIYERRPNSKKIKSSLQLLLAGKKLRSLMRSALTVTMLKPEYT